VQDNELEHLVVATASLEGCENPNYEDCPPRFERIVTNLILFHKRYQFQRLA